MSEGRTTVLKIGGSVITEKKGEPTPKTAEIDRLAGEIRKASEKNLILVHGGGSFGHPLANKYAIKDGLKEDSQKIGFAETHHSMTILNGLLMDSLVAWHNVPAVSIAPSSCIITENGRIKSFDTSTLKALLKMEFTPVFYGDAVLDTKLGFTILSGDQLVTRLAILLSSERIVIGVDVDGLYDADPKNHENARLIEHLNLEELKKIQAQLGKPSACDVTGGMVGKIAELIPAVENQIPVTIVNASKPNRVFKALKGETVEGTVIQKE